LIMATAVIALLGGLGSSIVASDMHRKTVTADAVVRNWAEQIQGALWVDCPQGPAPYGPPTATSNFTGTVTATSYGLKDGTFSTDRSTCVVGSTTNTVQMLTLVVRSTDGRGIARLELVKRKSP
jgi:hypothetical protein